MQVKYKNGGTKGGNTLGDTSNHWMSKETHLGTLPTIGWEMCFLSTTHNQGTWIDDSSWQRIQCDNHLQASTPLMASGPTF